MERSVRFKRDGRVLVASGTHEIGTGMYTIMTQVAADSLDISPDLIDADLGDSNLPQAPISAGSMSVASVTPAVQAAAAEARRKLLGIALADRRSAVYGATAEDVQFSKGKIVHQSLPRKSESFADLIARNGGKRIRDLPITADKLLV